MATNDHRSPVLIEHSPPPPFSHNLSVLNSPVSLATNLSNGFESTQRNSDNRHTYEQQAETMDPPPELAGDIPTIPDDIVVIPAESRHPDDSQNQPATAIVEVPQGDGVTTPTDSNRTATEDVPEQSPAVVHATGSILDQSPSTTEVNPNEQVAGTEAEAQETTLNRTSGSTAETDSTPSQVEPSPVLEEGNPGEETTPAEATNETTSPQQDPESEESTSNVEDDTPAWVKFEEDTSAPDEEEMKEIEGSEYDKLSALDISAMEEQFYTDVEDPDQRPIKKLRLSWVIKGVRGTKERPNFARVMNSPGACVDGLYWSIKFYPRGDNCSSLSAFVRCSREPPPEDEECPESEFSYFEGPPDADFSTNCEPKTKMTKPAKHRPKPEPKVDEQGSVSTAEQKKQTEVVESEETGQSPTAPGDATDAPADKVAPRDLPSWRVSAQLGMAIYNPVEARTGHLQSDGHQFSRHCDDWGWVNFVGPWDEIHKRKRGQRQPLLKNDTLAIDAYIRIYDDPTQALWWHDSKDESQWPSKELAGYFSMGTPGLYHSPAVAGLTAWMLITPFRRLLQSADGCRWKSDSNFNPRPLICQSQLVLDQMRNLSSDCYVNVYKIIEEFLDVDEHWSDVKSFWEVFRRGLELEFADEPNALQKLSCLFDVGSARWNIPSLPVPDTTSFQQGLSHHFSATSYKGSLPNFLPVMLNRSTFDTKTREWNLHHDRVSLDDELDLSNWCTDSDSSFTLYGFMVHVGPRNSGKFYSILRPGGINTKWLAFEDGNGNKVFSYSRKRIQEFEGLEGEELRKFPASQTRENVYMAMYIRNSCLKEYLLGGLEPYRVPKWLKPWADDSREDDDESHIDLESAAQTPSEAPKPDEDSIKVELYLDECAQGCENMLKLHDLRTSSVAREICRTVTVATDKTFKELRSAIAEALEVEDRSNICMWEIGYHGLGKHSRAALEPITYRRKITKEADLGQIFRIWLSVQQPVGGTASHKHLVDRLNDLGLDKKTPEKESKGIVDCVDTKTDVPLIDSAAEDLTSSTQDNVSNDNVGLSAPDAEQASVQAAVGTDLENASANLDSADVDADVDVTVTPASTEQSERSEGEDGVMTPTSSARSVALDQESTSTESTLEAPSEPTEEAIPESPANPADPSDESSRPVVHGHLVDAAQHSDSAAGVAITHTSAHVPHGDVDALAQVLAEEAPSHDEQQSSETERGAEAVQAEPVQAEAVEAEVVQAEQEDQNQTPTPPPTLLTYGNIQFFDADKQRFLAQRPFYPDFEMEIGAAVRKQMGYDDQRQFRVWKRLGATGTESVSLSTTFANAGLQEVFTLIVGDVLSETKSEELKTAGKFWQPQQLISYLGMLNRNHPHAALTSTGPVELDDFGGDYFKGPLCRGRPHGESGHLITSTGHAYTGPFIAGQKSGSQGKMIYQNGDTYVGDWFNDERHGQGEFVEKRTGNRYVGGFENGKRWGQGTTYWQVADQQADMCQICYEEEIDALFYDCGHVCACVTCAKQCDTCPLCRRSVRQVVKMFRA